MQDAPKDDNAQAEPPLFEATLYPHRSLSPAGFWVLMAAVSGVSFVFGMVFAAAGAWPILGFLGADVLLFYIAFRLNYRSGRLVETIRLTRSEFLVRRVHPNGHVQEWRMEPYWLQVRAVPRDIALGAPTAEICLSSHGRSVSLGRFLTDDERAELSIEINDALNNCRSLPAPT